LTSDEIKKLKNETKMVVQMPEGCISEDNCQWICDNMVGATGAKNESDYKGLDTPSSRRMLAEIRTVYTSTGGYEPDSDANTEGFDTEFVEAVQVLPPTPDEEEKNSNVLVLAAGLIVIVTALIIIAVCVMKSKQNKNQG